MAKKFSIPSKVDGLTVDQLDKGIAEAVEEFDELKADENLDAKGLERLRELAKFVQDAKTEKKRLEDEAVAQAKEVADLDALLHPADDPEGDDGDGGDGTTDPGTTQDPAAVDEPAGDPVPVLAAGGGKRQGPARRPEPEKDFALAMRVTAAVGLNTHEAGAAIRDVDDLCKAFNSRQRSFPRPSGRDRTYKPVETRIQAGVATFTRPLMPNEIRIENPTDTVMSQETFWEKVDRLGNAEHQAMLTGGSLAASGGWCAPNQRVFDLCPGLETTEGIATWPGFQLERGGIEYPNNIDFATLFANANNGFYQTEANSIAGVDKVCYTVDCPTFTSARLEIDGVCFKQDIIQNSVWPEVTRWIMSRVIVAHEHKINQRLLAQMETGSTAVTLPLGTDVDGDQTTSGLVGALAMIATHYRLQLRMSPTATIEGKAPSWLREWALNDMARRAGVTYWDLPANWLDTQLRRRNIVIDWVVDWQDGLITNTLPGGSAWNGTWPASVLVTMFAPGTWVKGGNGIIDLSAIYDSVGLTDNNYTAAFTEESTLLIKKCYPSLKATIPLCPTGATSTLASFDCTAP